MSNPYTIDSKRIEIARPIHTWETNHVPFVNEGPQIIIHNQTINLIFSASGSWTNDYCMGLITIHIDSDPMNPISWYKRSKPILQSGNGLFGPGHGSLTSDDWIIFHTAAYDGSGWTRQIRTQPFTWNEDEGIPVFGELQDPNSPIRLPRGEPQRQRYQLDSSVQHPTFTIEIDNEGLYTIAMRVRSKELTKPTKYLININGKDHEEINILYSDNWSSILVLVEFHRGQNVVIFSNIGTVKGEIASIDVFPRMSQ